MEKDLPQEQVDTACGFVTTKPDGIVGDLGGGSLELTEVHGHKVKPGVTLPLGGLALQDISSKSIKKAEKIVRSALKRARLLEHSTWLRRVENGIYLSGTMARDYFADPQGAEAPALLGEAKSIAQGIEDTIRQGFDYQYFAIKNSDGEVRAIQPFFILEQDLLAGINSRIRAMAD